MLQEIWSRVRKKHLFPQLKSPEIADSTEAVAIEMKGKQIVINSSFLNKMVKEMPLGEILEALLDHGISHYTYCPWDFDTHLRLYARAKEVVGDKEMAQRATDCFMDIVANTYCVKKKETKIPELYRHLGEAEVLDAVISALYQKIWGVDLGIKGYEDLVKRLSRIPYLDKRKWDESIAKFSTNIKQLLDVERKDQKTSGKGTRNILGNHDLLSYSQEEIDKGLREFAYRTNDPSRFREMVEDFLEKLFQSDYEQKIKMGRGKGNPLNANALFYMKLAEKYSLHVSEITMEKTGSLYPYCHTPWEISKPIQDVDVWTSFGKIIPGITQTWVRCEGEMFGRKEGVPDCIILIDSSGSMTDPTRNLSYAVLGAGCACDAYLRLDSRVAVYNFSDAMAGGKEILDFTRERGTIYQAMCRYFGGGTQLEVADIESIKKGISAKKNPDIFIITDMQITNLEKLIDYLLYIENRVTAVYIGKNQHAMRFKKAVERERNISVYSVERKEDIPKIILGKVREYIGGYFSPVAH